MRACRGARALLLAAALAPAAACLPAPAAPPPYPHAAEPIGTVREIYDGTLPPARAVTTFRNIDRLFPTRTVPAAGDRTRVYPLPVDSRPFPDVAITHDGRRYTLDEYVEANRVAGLLVVHDGRIRLERYRFGNTPRTRWMSMSIAKSITSTLVGAALRDGRIGRLADPVTRYVPALAGSAYDGVTVEQILTMTSGVRWSETYTDPSSDRRQLLEAQIAQTPGGALAVMRGLPRAAPPGTRHTYSTGETQIAAEVVRGATGRPLADYLSDRIWGRFAMEDDATWWLESPDGIEIGGSGISATLRDYGRFGLFVLGGGVADGEAILPEGWIARATRPRALPDGSPLDYGYLWWPGTTPASRRDAAYLAVGIHGQMICVNPATGVVAVVLGAQPHPTADLVVEEWAFCDAVNAALR